MYLRRLSFNELNSHAGDESSHYLKLLAIHLPSIHRLDCSSLPLEEWMSLWPPGPTAPHRLLLLLLPRPLLLLLQRTSRRRETGTKGGEGGNTEAFKAFGCGDERGGGGLLLRIPPSLCGVILARGVLQPLLAASALACSLARSQRDAALAALAFHHSA